MAKLYFRYGAMNSGKSTALLQVAYNYEERDMKVLLVKPKIDSKGKNKIVSRLGVEREVDIMASKAMNLFQTVKQWNKDVEKISCVLVDEAQFLSEEQISQLFNLTVEENIPVICYGLRSDFQKNLFPGSGRLFALAHTIEELKTICRCGRKAILNTRKVGDKFVFEGPQVAIEGNEEVNYISLCGKCYAEEYAKTHLGNQTE